MATSRYARAAYVELADERLAKRVDKRTAGLVTDRNADPAREAIVRLNVVGGEEEIVAAIEMNCGRRPDRIGRPGNVMNVEDMRMSGPMNKVG